MGGKKFMGLPVVVWLGVAAAGLLLGIYLRSRGGGGSSEPTSGWQPITLPGFPEQGSITDAVAGGGVAPAGAGLDPAIMNDLFTGQAEQGQAITTLTTHVDGLVDSIGSLVYAIPSSGGSGASATGNAPAQKPPPIKTATKPAPKKPLPKPKPPAKYWTYKKDVKLGKGQTLKFTAGKGYYAG